MRTGPSAPGRSTPRRGLALRRSALLAVPVAAILLAWAGPAAAKGPMPVAPEPTGTLTSGQETEIVVRLEWPGGEIPAGLGPEAYDMWGDDLPWELLAVVGSTASDEALADAELLPLTHRGQDRYTASFTPDAVGDWTLVVAAADGGDGWLPLQERPVRVGEPESTSPTRAAVGAGAVVVAAIGCGAVVLRRRGSAPPSVG